MTKSRKKQTAFICYSLTLFICLTTRSELDKPQTKPLPSISTSSMYKKMSKDGEKVTSHYHVHQLEKKLNTEEQLIKKAELYIQKNEIDKAIGVYENIIQIDPSSFHAYFSLGNLLYNENKLDLALKNYECAFQLNQTSAIIQYNIGLCLKKKNATLQAIEHFKAAVNLNPSYEQAYRNWAILAAQLKQTEEAIKLFDKALAIAPHDTIALRELGIIYQNQGLYDKAIEILTQAYRQEPKNVITIMELANTLHLANKYEQALIMYQHAIELRPLLDSALYNVGYILKQQGYINQAIEVFNKVLEIAPNNNKAHYNLGLCHLILGNLQVGLQEYEWRWEASNTEKPFFGKAPYWDGSQLNGKHLLITCEQDLGDIIQFVRYAEILHQQGAHISLVVQQPIKNFLLDSCKYIDTFIEQDDNVPDADYQVPITSIPAILNTQLETIPAKIPYLQANLTKVEYWKTKLNPATYNIGIYCPNNTQTTLGETFSLTNFSPLTAIAGCTFYIFQKNSELTQPQNPLCGPTIVDLSDGLCTKSEKIIDIAALIATLDLLITIDSPIAHLAAAIGKPTWILLPYPANWRWMLNRADSPWYPHVRLFRQNPHEKWPDIINKVTQAIHDTLKKETVPHISKSTIPAPEQKEISDQSNSRQQRVMPYQEEPLDEFIDNLTICTIKAGTSTDINELQKICSMQESMQEQYRTYIKIMPQLKDLTACLLSSNNLLLSMEHNLKKINSIFDPEFQNIITQSNWIISFKNNIKNKIKQLSNTIKNKDHIEIFN